MTKVKTKRIGGFSFFNWSRPYTVVVQDEEYRKELMSSYYDLKRIIEKYSNKSLYKRKVIK